jgi:hypothetical protein
VNSVGSGSLRTTCSRFSVASPPVELFWVICTGIPSSGLIHRPRVLVIGLSLPRTRLEMIRLRPHAAPSGERSARPRNHPPVTPSRRAGVYAGGCGLCHSWRAATYASLAASRFIRARSSSTAVACEPSARITGHLRVTSQTSRHLRRASWLQPVLTFREQVG